MRVVLQRVNNASVLTEGEVCCKIGRGYLMFLGIGENDTRKTAEKMVEKISKLRIFEDENGKTNLSAGDIGGEMLVVSQFTLYADCRKGNRPGFTLAAKPQIANELYEYVKELCRKYFKTVQCGVFGADMKVNLENDGPFTLMLDSDTLF